MGVEWGKSKPLGNYFISLIEGHEGDFHWSLIPFMLIWAGFVGLIILWLFTIFIVPYPRKPLPSEKKYRTLDKDGNLTSPKELPSWMDAAKMKWLEAQQSNQEFNPRKYVERAEVFMTLVIPAFNEEKRLIGMLEESVNFLEKHYSNVPAPKQKQPSSGARQRKGQGQPDIYEPIPDSIYQDLTPKGWEILLVDDGSTDSTLKVAEHFTRTHLLPAHPRPASGPWTPNPKTAVNIPPDSIRMIHLEQNRGKGGAVTHGMRHARGAYILFADADGASDITDLPKLVSAADGVADSESRAVAVGSRAHMVNSEAVVRRSKLRNFLMHAFHTLLWIMTPPKTACVKDTQCGFKLFTRATLPYIIPHMHMEGWIFDVEMLMLAEFQGIPVVEVPIGWKEVVGSKLNVIKDSISMAWNLAILRFCWMTGIYY